MKTLRLVVMAATLFAAACKSSPSPPPPPAADVGRAPTWEVKLPGGYAQNAIHATVSGDLLIARTPKSLVVFDRRTSKQNWMFDLDVPDGWTIHVADGVVVLAQAIPRQTGMSVQVRDLTTGKTLWADNNVAIATYFSAVFTSDASCADKCPLSRRDLRTGKPVWTVPAGLFPRPFRSQFGPSAVGSLIAPSLGPYLMLLGGSRPTWRIYAVDAASGARYASLPYIDGPTVVTERTLVGLEAGSNGCKRVLQGVDARSGQPRWRAEIRTYDYLEGSEDECPGRLHMLYSDNKILGTPPATMFSTDASDRPIALDLDTGTVRWVGSRSAVPVDADEKTVLVRDAGGLQLAVRDHWRKGRLAALDAASGKQLWVAPAPPKEETWGPLTGVFNGVVLDAIEERRVTVRDTKTGAEKWQTREGNLIGGGPGWLAITYVDFLRYYAF